MIDLVCPSCRTRLTTEGTALICPGCSRSYEVRDGVPDLRVLDDLYMPNDRDRQLAAALRRETATAGFRATIERYLRLDASLSDAQRTRQVQHILTAGDRVRAWIAAVGSEVPAGPWLDLGCGSGSFLAVAARAGIDVVGIDVAERWLVVAGKRLDEDGLAAVLRVCGNAEKLPFHDQTFAVVIAGDVIEHVSDQAATVGEAHRVLMPGGRLFMATPNRFSLTPEPHVGVWGVGFLPRPLMGPYIWLLRRVEFRAVRTLGYAGWTRLLRRSPFAGATIEVPALPQADIAAMPAFKRRLARAYNRLVATRPGRSAMGWFGPLFHIHARRSDTPATIPVPRPSTTQ